MVAPSLTVNDRRCGRFSAVSIVCSQVSRQSPRRPRIMSANAATSSVVRRRPRACGPDPFELGGSLRVERV